MELTGVLVLISSAVLLFQVILLIWGVIHKESVRAHRASSVADTPGIMRLIPRWFQRGYRRFVARSRMGRIFESIERGAQLKGMRIDAVSVCFISVLSAVSVSIGVLILGNVTSALLTPFVVICVLVILSERLARRFDQALMEELPHALRAIESCVSSGATLEVVFSELAASMHGPIREMAQRIHSELVLGAAPLSALRTWMDSSIEELRMVGLALVIQHETGGSLKEILSHAILAAEHSLALQAKLRSQTAQARLSAQSVIGVTVGLVTLISIFVPDFLIPFFSSVVGVVLLVIAIGMQVAGIFVIRRQLAIPGMSEARS